LSGRADARSAGKAGRRHAAASERGQRRTGPAPAHLGDLLFGDGRIGRPIVGEHIVAQHRDVSIAECIGVGRVTAEAGHEGLSPRYRAIHAKQDGGNKIGRTFGAGRRVQEQARIVAVLAALTFSRMAGGAIAFK